MSFIVRSLNCPVCTVSHTPATGKLRNGVYAGTCQNCGYFFKFRAVEDTYDTVTFTVNGTQYTVGNEFDLTASLSEWLRYQGVSTGTKQLCLEGGCGVCLVAAKLYEPVTFTNQVYSIKSCLVQLYMCDGWEITTIEGLGNTRDGLHTIQQRLLQYNGSQCGYCSPSQVINMYGLLKRNPQPTKQEVEDNFDTTICRCTGYRAILDAMKSFAVDAPKSLSGGPIDIEDLNPKLCKTSGKTCSGKCHTGGASPGTRGGQTRSKANNSSSSSMAGHSGRAVPGVPLHIVANRAQWFKPTTLEALYALLQQFRAANYRLVFGNTGYGIYKELAPWFYDILIDIRGIKALYRLDFDPKIVLGANISISNFLEFLKTKGSDPSVRAYFLDFRDHVKQVASNAIRNIASVAGNLMLKHKHPFFISNIYTMLETVGAKLFIADGNGAETQVNLESFLVLDMKGKVITAISLPKYTTDDVYIRTFRVAQRLQLDHGYVLAGFNFQLDKNQNFLVKERPTMVFQGINTPTNHATQTETFLTGKQLGDPQVLQGAMNTLAQELKPMSDPALASPQYRHNLACALFYKYVLGVCSTKAAERFHSGSVNLYRPVSTAFQSYGSRKDEWPLTEPMTKLEAAYQVTGETKYLDDLPVCQGELFASFVLSDKGNAKLASMDPSAALNMKGVHKFIKASDIPAGGKNNFAIRVSGAAMEENMKFMKASNIHAHGRNAFGMNLPKAAVEELLCSGQILYAGQPLGIIVADDPQTADLAADQVKVTYSDVQKPITDMQEAIQQRSFFDVPSFQPEVVGQPDDAITASAHKITGTIQVGWQYHFHMEPQISRCAPNGTGGLNVHTTTQWIDATAQVIAGILNLPQSALTVEVSNLGGAFGAKITRNNLAAGGCALAAYIMNRPIRLRMNLHSNMKALGKRHPYYASYEVGFTDEGKLNGVNVTVYTDCGCAPNDNSLFYMFEFMDNAYFCENWKMTPVFVKTNTPCNTACRSPGSLPAQFIMESMMEHVAKALNKDPSDVRKINFYTKGQTTPFGMRLDYCNLAPLITQLETSCDWATRKNQVALFNQANRWKKRGISMVPTKFGIFWTQSPYNVLIAIYHADGTIAIEHGGIEVGQGINTKAAQVCAYELGVPLSLVRVKKGSSMGNANSSTTGGSKTSELNCMGVVECCKILRARMDTVRQSMTNPSWKELVAACYDKGIDLSANYYANGRHQYFFRYNVYAATVTEVEVDILTGQSQIIRSDMLYDCGESMNPELDMGQIEGGFMMGLGYHLTEKQRFDPTTGTLLTDGTWEYKPPLPKDLPIDFRVSLLKNAPSPQGVLRSKTAGEPPLMMSASALFAIKYAVQAARAEIGQDDFFTLNSPALVEDIQLASMVNPSQFTYGQ